MFQRFAKVEFRILGWMALAFVLVAVSVFFCFSLEDSESRLYHQLHHQFDPSYPGRGLIDYSDNPVGDIPKSYAMILKAELNRSASGHMPDLPSLASAAGNWLLDHADEDRDGVIGWGVPVSWDAFGDGTPNPANAEYTIATAIAVDALLDWLEQSPEARRHRIMDIVGAAFEPYLRADVLSPSGLFPYSLELQDRRYDVFNPAAYLAGQMQRYAHLQKDDELAARLKNKADRTMAALIEHRKLDPDGNWYWAYSVQEDDVPNDLAHAVYIMHGVRTYAKNGGQLAAQLEWEKAAAHLDQFTPEHRLYVRGWPAFYTATEQPARSYGIGMALLFSARDDAVSKSVSELLRLSALYRSADGGYTKYPNVAIHGYFEPSENDKIVIQEYQAFMLAGLSYLRFGPSSH